MKPITKYACELDRIYGTETEYGLYWKGGKIDIFSVMCESFARTILDFNDLFDFNDLPFTRLNEIYLQNGGMIKKDNIDERNDCTPEYATPECRSARDAVCWEKAGEVIMHNLFDLSGRNSSNFLMVKHGRGFTDLPDVDKVVSEVSCGHHENYSYDKELKEEFKKDSWEALVFMSFLASRILFSGAGWIGPRGFGYQLSQRADFMEQKTGTATIQNRPLICMREEPGQSLGILSPPRFHLIAGEHLMSEVALYLTLGSTGLVLRMLELGCNFDDAPILNDPLESLRRFNSDPALKIESMLSGLKKGISALEIQNYFCAKAKEFVNHNPSTEEEHDIVDYWMSVLGRLKKDIYSLYGELDWVTKLCLTESYLEKHGIQPENIGDFYGAPPQILDYCMSIDLMYHFITPDGLYNKLKKSGLIKRLLTDSEILDAVTNPPQDTRAKVRGEIVRLLMVGKIKGRVHNWNSFGFGECPTNPLLNGALIAMEDPFDFHCQVWQDSKKSLGPI